MYPLLHPEGRVTQRWLLSLTCSCASISWGKISIIAVRYKPSFRLFFHCSLLWSVRVPIEMSTREKRKDKWQLYSTAVTGERRNKNLQFASLLEEVFFKTTWFTLHQLLALPVDFLGDRSCLNLVQPGVTWGEMGTTSICVLHKTGASWGQIQSGGCSAFCKCLRGCVSFLWSSK